MPTRSRTHRFRWSADASAGAAGDTDAAGTRNLAENLPVTSATRPPARTAAAGNMIISYRMYDADPMLTTMTPVAAAAPTNTAAASDVNRRTIATPAATNRASSTRSPCHM